jgi:hypothetical protein
MITDLRIGNCVVIQKNSEYHAGIIQTLGDTKCGVKDNSDKIVSLPYDNFRPAKITKRWLHDNEFDDIDEGSPEGLSMEEPGSSSSRFVHRSLPISYSHGDHRLFVYGHIFPVKVLYVHHIQNALIDCGILFEPVFRDSHCSQVEGCPIIQLLGGMKKSPEFFDTNAAFGFSGMPKLKMAPSGRAMSNKRPASPYVIDFQRNFVSIMGIRDEEVRNLARFFYDEVGIDNTGNFTSVSLSRVGPEVYVFLTLTDGRSKNSIPVSFEGITRFIDEYPNIVRERRYRLAIAASGEERNKLLEVHPEVLLNNEISNEISIHPGRAKFVYTRRGRIDGLYRVDVKGFNTGSWYEKVLESHIEDLVANIGGIVSFEELSERDFERFDGRPSFSSGIGYFNQAKLPEEESPFYMNEEGPADGNLVDVDMNFGEEAELPQMRQEEEVGDVAEPREVERGPEPEIYSVNTGKKKKNKKGSR